MMDPARKQKLSLIALAVVSVVAIVIVASMAPIAQPTSYHQFADNRAFLGIPNFWNVVSNVPFLIVGILGLRVVLKRRYPGGLPLLHPLYAAFFIGIALVCFGSGYYHWKPSNDTLAWDRLPMAIAFMIFLSIAVGEHVHDRIGRFAAIPLVAIGIFSVWYWDHTESLGRGDLRLYILVQFLTLLMLIMIFALLKSRLSRNGYLWAMFAGYVAAKVLEELDQSIFSLGGWMSGHALKHAVAAAGMYCFVLALQKRAMIDA